MIGQVTYNFTKTLSYTWLLKFKDALDLGHFYIKGDC